jgi:hypothetical protein
MSLGFLIQSAASLVAVMMLVGLAAWARIGRPCPPLDATSARRMLAEEFPDHTITGVWVAADGGAAIGRAGGQALILFRMGDVYVARSAPWRALATAQVSGDSARLRLGDVGAPQTTLRLARGHAWPPALESAA